MSVLASIRNSLSGLFGSSRGPKQIGVYGPPNGGKSTLCNRILRDWTDDEMGTTSHVAHETVKVKSKDNVVIEHEDYEVQINIVDTPGVATKVDYTEFLDEGFERDDAVRRSREATQGISEAMHWLKEDIDGVLYVLDSTKDPFTQVNTMVTGIIEGQDIPVLILANKIDLDDSDVERIIEAHPDKDVVPLSALEGDNMDEVYAKIAAKFG
jgi:hypothetical protein